MKISCSILDLGRMEYDTALSLQRHLIQEKRNGREEDILLFVEHPPVITMGRGGNGKNILVDSRTLSDRGVSFYEIERGGDVTYHGPGQIVGYPIFDLNRHGKDLHRFLRNLEEVLILTLETFGLKGRREKGMTGVWVNGEKVAAIGVAVKHWITFHGFALNVNTDLSYFDLICPCGIAERGITSLEKLLGRQVKLGEVKERIVNGFIEIFGIRPFYCSVATPVATENHPHLLSSPIKGEEEDLPSLFLITGEKLPNLLSPSMVADAAYSAVVATKAGPMLWSPAPHSFGDGARRSGEI